LNQNPLIKSSKTAKKIVVTPDIAHITQEKIINSDQLLTLIPLIENKENLFSRILLLKIKDDIKNVVFTMYPSQTKNTKNFTGKIIMSTINGDFINGYTVKEGVLQTQFVKKKTSSANHRSIIIDGVVFEELDEVVIINNYQSGPGSINIMSLFSASSNFAGGGGEIDYSWDYGGGSGGEGQPISCGPGYLQDVNGNCVSATQAIEDNIDDSKLDLCSKTILDKLKNATNADIKSIFDKLGGTSEVYTLSFEIGNNYGNPASTNWTSTNCYKTIIDNDFLYGIDGTGINKPPTDLAIGAVMIHEMVHAYFFSLLDDKNSGITGAFDNFDLLYNNYVTKTFAGADDAQHAQIWKSFIGNLASTLQEYHTGNGTNPSQFYTDIILGTLSKTKKFKDTYPEGTVEFSRIMNTFLTEKNNGSNDPNYTPKGKPCPK